MLESIAHLGTQLKEARQQKKLSQRALGRKIGMPQSHISKIENGATDLQASSLIELSRNLDLELMLVPRELVPSFRALMQGKNKGTRRQIPLYRLDNEDAYEDDD